MKDDPTCLAAAQLRVPGKHDISNRPGAKPAAFTMTAIMGAAFIGLTLPADAQVYWGPDDAYFSRRFESRPRESRSIERKRQHVARVKRQREAEPVKEVSKPKGPVVIAISINNQQLKIYDENGVFAQSPVSTGMRGHPTPMGVFSVIGKEKFHRSNIYSGAPMPYMQRITWSGVAMHAGVLPGYPASHGCIRMPANFAVRMYGWTKPGARVVITPGELSPSEFSHPLLFTRKPDPAPAVEASKDAPKDTVVSTPKSDKASADQIRTADASGALPQKLDDAKPADAPAADAKSADSKPDGKPETASASDTEPKKDKDQTRRSDGDKPVTVALTDAAKADAGKSDKPAAVPKPRTGHISAYISRKAGKLFVRQNFEPLFETPIEIADPARPLGTHVFTMLADKDNPQAYHWWVVSLPSRNADEPPPRRKKGAEPVAQAPGVPPSSPSEALDRLKIPPEAMQKIAEAIVPGGSITISDQGLGDETGLGTDFIVPLR